MPTELTLNNLKIIRQDLGDAIDVIRNKALEAYESRKISRSNLLKAKNEWGKLENSYIELAGLIMNKELDFILDTDVESPHSRIIQATNSLENAAQRIDNFASFLSEIGRVLGIFTSITKAISTGGILNIA